MGLLRPWSWRLAMKFGSIRFARVINPPVFPWNSAAFLYLVASLAACNGDQTTAPHNGGGSILGAAVGSAFVTNVSRDTTAQNETPLAFNPRNPQNLLTGNNDWNNNDGCGTNVSFNGGKTWTRTLPDGFLPGVTKYTNDPSVPGTGAYDFGGDPAVAFGPDGTAYFACFGYQGTPPYGVVLLLSRSTDGGKTWLKGGAAEPLALVSAFQGNGKAKGSTGQFPDHEWIHVAEDGTIYIPWAHFTGYSAHSPIFVGVSRDGGRTFAAPVQVTSGTVRNDQDARIVTDPRTGYAYLTFDNAIQGGKGTAMFASVSKDRGATWSTPFKFATFQNPVCLFPPSCFNITGAEFRGPGSYPVPAFDPRTNRLYVAYSDIVNNKAQVLLTYADVGNISSWSTPAVVAPASGDRINVELSVEPSSGRLDLMANDRSYTSNALFDVAYMTSSDGGTSWSTTRVTTESWDPSQYGVPSSSSSTGIRPFIGDYDGIVSLPGSAAMTWTGPGKTYGSVPDNLEVYFGSVTP
jgi:hypothetical protein